jgi:ADP-heptose:LPS heptosyltransferase
VTLLAPSGPGGALVGPSPCEAHDLIPWESAELTRLLAGNGTPAARSFDAALAFTRDGDLVRGLAALAPRVTAHDPRPPAGEHAARWLASAAQGIAPDAAPSPPVCEATPDEASQAAQWLRRLPEGFVAVHPGSGSPAKNWPTDRFAAALEAAGASGRYLLIEGPADAESAAPLRAGAAALARSLPPRVLGAILSRARVYVGNDSGVSHLAAAWGAPTVALFGPTDPAVWSPVGPRVTVVRSADGRMDGIAVEQVLTAISATVAATGRQP